MAIKDLETRIIEKADKELQARIDAAFKPAETIYQQAPAFTVPEVIAGAKSSGSTGHSSPWYLLKSFKEQIFKAMCDKNREESLAEFLTQVESLQEQINELRDGVEV